MTHQLGKTQRNEGILTFFLDHGGHITASNGQKRGQRRPGALLSVSRHEGDGMRPYTANRHTGHLAEISEHNSIAAQQLTIQQSDLHTILQYSVKMPTAPTPPVAIVPTTQTTVRDYRQQRL